MKPGGTDGGTAPFLAGLGLILTALGLYLLFDSVHVTSGGAGIISGLLGGNSSWETASRGIIFVPLLAGIVTLFYNAKLWLGWLLLWGGIAILVTEILSRLQFYFNMKTSHLILILGLSAAGIGLMLRGLREEVTEKEKSDKP